MNGIILKKLLTLPVAILSRLMQNSEAGLLLPLPIIAARQVITTRQYNKEQKTITTFYCPKKQTGIYSGYLHLNIYCKTQLNWALILKMRKNTNLLLSV